MNRSKIEWCDHTWNPITGCRHNCEYCYAKKMSARFSGDVRLNIMAKDDYEIAYAADGGKEIYILDNQMLNETGNTLVYPFGFEPTYHKYRMNYPEKLKMGKNVFVGAMADVFGEWVPDEWLDDIFNVCRKNPIHNYLFLTKNPDRYKQYQIPIDENMWYGTTITGNNGVKNLSCLPDKNRFVSVEPLLEEISDRCCEYLAMRSDWIIIGAETGKNKNKIVPNFEWIKNIVVAADYCNTPVFMKDSLIPIIGDENMRRNFPEKLKHLDISPKVKQRLYGSCAVCKKNKKKNDMITLLARSQRGEQPKQYGFMCKDCFEQYCKKYELEKPKLKNMEDK